STTITEAALVLGIPSGVYSIAGIESGDSFDFARVRRDRTRLDFDFLAFGAADSVSEAGSSFVVTAFALRTGPGTPLGRTRSESATSCAHALSSELRINAQRNETRLRQIMDGKLATKRLTAQVPALHICCHPERGRQLILRSANAWHKPPLYNVAAKCYFLPRSISSTS